jgi:methyl acetate hydrolase
MNRKIVGMAVGIGIACGAAAGAARAQNSPAGAAIDAALAAAIERKDVPGVVALVADRRRVLYQGAFGVADVSTGRALTADAVFRIASMTSRSRRSRPCSSSSRAASVSTIRWKSICRNLQT